ncbi:hypothetical protein PAMP_000616 [Pampus punctatissimus]
MPGDRDDEICQKALELLSDLCSKGEVQNDNCLDFIYYFRDLARPRYTDSVSESFQMSIDFSLPGSTLVACQPDCGLSILRWQVTQFPYFILSNHAFSGIQRNLEHRKDSLSEFLCEV